MTESAAPAFPCARFIKEIGRGPNGARALSRDDTYALYEAMLDGRVSDLELGAVLLAYRVKGETAAELAAMLAAAHRSFEPLHIQHGREHARPVSIPSYNGARRQPNLTPLLSLLLAREGVPVLVHGVIDDPGRVTSAEIFAELGIAKPRRTMKSRTVSRRADSRSRRSRRSRRSSRACCRCGGSWACAIRRIRSSRFSSRSRSRACGS